MTVLIHLLGAADLGVTPSDYPSALEELVSVSTEEQAGILARVRAEDHHAGGPPLLRVLEAIGKPPGLEVWLVATDQQPRHPGDTLRLAEAMAPVLAGDPEVFGRTVDCCILQVDRFGLESFGRVVADKLNSLPERERDVVVGISGGAVEAYLGILLGCVEVGREPSLIAVHGELGADRRRFGLVVDGDVKRWLVRSAGFAAVAEVVAESDQDAQASVWRLLDALRKLDWKRASEIAGRLEGIDYELLMRVTPPENHDPDNAQAWEFYRLVMGSVLLRRLGAGETTALHAARPWIEAEVTASYARFDDQGKGRFKGATETIRTQNPQTPFRREGLDVVPATRFPHKLARVTPQEKDLAEFLKKARRLGRSASTLDHGGQANWRAAVRRARLVDERLGSDPIASVLDKLGHKPWPLLPVQEQLVLQCVGTRDKEVRRSLVRGLTEGVSNATYPLEATKVMFVFSDDTKEAAHDMVSEARAAKVADAHLTGPVPVTSYAKARKVVLKDLRGLDQIQGVERVLFTCNPGSKAMNLAVLAAGLQWSYDTCKGFGVAPLRRLGDVTTLVADHGMERVPLRLAHDSALATAISTALKDLDFHLARRLIDLGSSRWSGLDRLITLLDDLLTSADTAIPLPPQGVDLGDIATADPGGWTHVSATELWPARTRLLTEIIERDPWGAIYRACAIAEGTFGKEWRSDNHRSCRRLWRWRNESPLGHRPWAKPPEPTEIRRALSRTAGELRKPSRLEGPSNIDDDVIVAFWKAMRKHVGRIAKK